MDEGTFFGTAGTRWDCGGLGADGGADLAEGVAGYFLDALLAHGGVVVEGPDAEALALGEVFGVDLFWPVSWRHIFVFFCVSSFFSSSLSGFLFIFIFFLYVLFGL